MADARDLPRRGDLIAGRYRVEHMLGKGGMGVVFRVTHHVTGRSFALKWLLPELAQEPDTAHRFLREAQVAGRLQHPNLVEIYDVGSDVNSYYMVMELLEGETLAERVERTGPLSPQDAYRLLIPCMRAVAAAHAAEIVHRDLKPANLFVCKAAETGQEIPKVLDFGISKMSALTGALEKVTKTGVLMGTPHYMPLEQMRGQPVDGRVDVYAFGVVLYQVLSGRLPFAANSFSDLVLQLASETPKPLDLVAHSVPPELARVVARAMARNADERYQSLDELMAALSECGERSLGIRASVYVPTVPNPALSLPTPLATESRVSRSRPANAATKRTGFGFWLSAVVIGLMAATGAWWTLTHKLGPSAQPTAAAQAAPVEVPKPAPTPEVQAPTLTEETPRPAQVEEALPVPATQPQPVEAKVEPPPPKPEVKPLPVAVPVKVPIRKLEPAPTPVPAQESAKEAPKFVPQRRVPTIDPTEF